MADREPSPTAAAGFRGGLKYPGLIANVKKNKGSFVQFLIMTGILISSLRSLGQKYAIHELTEETAALREEQESIIARLNHIKQSLRAEAAAEPTGAFAARLRLLIGDEWFTQSFSLWNSFILRNVFLRWMMN